MTTVTVPKTTANRTMVGIKYAIEDWVREVRVRREKARIEEWNMDYRARLDRHGVSSYK